MSKKTFLLGTAAVLVLACTPASASHFNGWYVGIEGGANWIGDIDNELHTTLFTPFGDTFTTPFTPRRHTADFDTGWAVLATVGYGFGGGWRGEFEVGYRDNDADANLGFLTTVPQVNPLIVLPFPPPPGFFTGTVPVGIDVSEVSLMANVLYDISFGERMSLSLGAGIGADQLDYDVSVGPFFDGGPGFSRGDTTWKFAWQLIAGFNYQVASQTAVFLNYRYLQVELDSGDDHFEGFREFGPLDGVFLDAHLRRDDNIDKQSVTIGLRFDLAPDYVAPPPPPPAPPPPPPPPAPKDFIVFFGFDKYNLTPEAATIVQQAAQAFKETGAANVKVVGHTDRAGSDEYNQALSMRRANTVRGGLTAEGVPDGSISVDGRGESEPMVATDDGVREPQNRRVNITF